MKSMIRTAFVVSATVLLASTAVAADEENPFERGTKDVFSVSLGGFFMNFNTSAKLDPDAGGEGTDIDLENDFDLDPRITRGRLDGYWRFARKHRVDFGGYLFDRSNSRVLDKEIVFGDTTYDVGAELDTKFRTSLFKLSYRYSFIRNDRIDFSGSAGLSTITTRLEIEGFGSVNGQTASFDESSKRVIAPVPVFGLLVDLKIVRSLFFRLGGEYFHIQASGVDGRFSDARASLDWYPFKHFGFGAGYNRVGLRAEDTEGANYDLEYSFDGLLGYATYVY
jgi:hypothetical protein